MTKANYEKSAKVKEKLYLAKLEPLYEGIIDKVLSFEDPELLSPLEGIILTAPKKGEEVKPSFLRKACYSKIFNYLKDGTDVFSEIKLSLLKTMYTKEAGELSYNKLIGKY